MSSAKHAARVGAVAFTLGLGAAMASGTAYAAPDDPSEGSGGSSSSAESHPSTTKSADKKPLNKNSAGSSDTADTAQGPSDDTDHDLGDSKSDAERAGGGEDGAAGAESVKIREKHSRTGPSATSADDQPIESPEVVDGGDPVLPDDNSTGAVVEEPTTTAPGRSDTPTVGAGDAGSETLADDRGPTVVSRPLGSAELTVSNVEGDDLPSGPSGPALLLAVVQGVIRDFNRFFFNSRPSFDPRQVVASGATGMVYGTLNASDRDGDPLVYTVTEQPVNGTVVVNPDGTYVYIPKQELLSAGGQCGPTACFDAYTDSFKVDVADKGFNLRKLIGYLIGAPTSVATSVSVNVPQTNVGAGALSQTFRVYNATRNQVKITTTTAFTKTHDAGINTLNAPALGATLEPGEFHEYQVTFWAFHVTGVEVTYTSTDGSAWRTYMSTDLFNSRGITCKTSNAVCNPTSFTGGDTIVLMEQPGAPDIEIPAGQGQRQADVLNRMCSGGIASCSFKVRSKVATYAPRRQVWDYTTGSGSANLSEAIKISNSASNSVEVSAKAGVNIKAIVSAEIASKYSHTWTEGYEVNRTISNTVKPYTHFILYVETPVQRYTGDFTVKIGNTTWTLRDVYFDQPDKDRTVRYLEVDVPVRPRTIV
ncbi:Ig-like domain-containing protein [Mycobacterium sp. 236(2023)]|uniref:Ig-like domain-containing protein n=1 Tax=Mycobacterium sp. 236(2023) TaxID=3038163 RepID=UPI002414EFB9|nr:Ig-like domain-containing protein [Mycobacterium sp. 236(2023)]MDG4665866.1 Ig-like domain-containing protein [Mycobacterium sp. 236(2023)]